MVSVLFLRGPPEGTVKRGRDEEILPRAATHGVNRNSQTLEVRDAAALPLSLGGLGLRSACRMRVPAYWASWADCFGMIHQRHPDVADQLVRELDGNPQTPCLQAAASAVRELTGVMGFVPPSWDVLVG